MPLCGGVGFKTYKLIPEAQALDRLDAMVPRELATDADKRLRVAPESAGEELRELEVGIVHEG